jgi:hypothetical protein
MAELMCRSVSLLDAEFKGINPVTMFVPEV